MTNIEHGMQLLIHGVSPGLIFPTIPEGISRGRHLLVYCTDEDFGYDIKAWHDFLSTEFRDEYHNASVPGDYPDEILNAYNDVFREDSIAVAKSKFPIEEISRLMSLYGDALVKADEIWSNRERKCPRCNTQFVSVKNRGQCPECSFVFLASHPLGEGNDSWWRKDPYCTDV